MKRYRSMNRTVLLVLASALVTAGCGGPSPPPPGAPKTTQSPEVDLGKIEPDEAGRDESGTEVAARPADQETTTDEAAVGWATLSGRIVYDGPAPEPKTIEPTKDVEVCGMHEIPDEDVVVSSDGGLANAVVMLRTKGVEVAPSFASDAGAKVLLDNKNCRFEPHVAVVRTSQELALSNSDPIVHNSKVDPLINPGTNPILPAGGDPISFKFELAEGFPVKVGCNIHPWMGAWLVVREDPYAAVTDSDGNFTIKDLPAGEELEFGLWQETSGYLRDATFEGGKTDRRGGFKIKLKPGENDLGDIKVDPSIFEK